jgi:hypothetical protein
MTEKVAAAPKAKKNEQDNGRQTDGFEYDKSHAKTLQKVLHNLNVALGTQIAAMKDLAMLRGSDITPDGKLGGRGFVMEFKEMKSLLNESINNLSDITDSIGDELTNPKWGLSKTQVKKIEKEKDKVQDEVEEVQEEIKEEKAEESLDDLRMSQPSDNIEEKESQEKKDIDPSDVKDSSYVESVRKYKEMLEDPNKKDKVAAIIRRSIQANLLR